MNETFSALVSIIVPVYNTERYLPECLDSLIHQTYQNLEIILVNDGSTDQSLHICMDYQNRDKRIRLMHKRNEGHMYACRDGFYRSKGRYIMFVDSDDWIDVNTVEICVDIMKKHHPDCVMFSYTKEYENNSIDNYIYQQDYCFLDKEAQDKVHRRIIGPIEYELCRPHRLDNMSTLWGKLYKRNVVEQGRFVSERVIGTSDDTVFNIYALKQCKKINYVNQCLYHYRKCNTQSITTRYNAALADQWDILYQMIESHLQEEEYSEYYWEAYYNRVACGMIGLGLNEVQAKVGFFEKTKRVVRITQKKLYKEAFQRLKMEYCPWYWRVFFWMCKYSGWFGGGLIYMLRAIESMRTK